MSRHLTEVNRPDTGHYNTSGGAKVMLQLSSENVVAITMKFIRTIHMSSAIMTLFFHKVSPHFQHTIANAE
jgi:hypothetical protein